MITATLSAPEAAVVYGGLNRLVDGLLAQAVDTAETIVGERERPTRAQLRADALVTLFAAVDGDDRVLPQLPRAGTPTPAINVTISASTLLGLDDNPGELAGYGPIPADLARELAADGVWARFVTDPLTGVLLDDTPHRYRPKARLRAHVTSRDLMCRHPGCSTAAVRADLDHVREFDHGDPPSGGPTVRANLTPKCRRHHNAKTWWGRIQVVVATPGSVVEDRSSSLNASAGVRHSRVLRGLPLSEAAASSRSCLVN